MSRQVGREVRTVVHDEVQVSVHATGFQHAPHAALWPRHGPPHTHPTRRARSCPILTHPLHASPPPDPAAHALDAPRRTVSGAYDIPTFFKHSD
jgi:hypothetical protein